VRNPRVRSEELMIYGRRWGRLVLADPCRRRCPAYRRPIWSGSSSCFLFFCAPVLCHGTHARSIESAEHHAFTASTGVDFLRPSPPVLYRRSMVQPILAAPKRAEPWIPAPSAGMTKRGYANSNRHSLGMVGHSPPLRIPPTKNAAGFPTAFPYIRRCGDQRRRPRRPISPS